MMLAAALAAPSLIIGVLSDGPGAARVFQSGLVVLGGCAVAAVWMWRQGARIDREQDEREGLIIGRTATFMCVVMAIALQGYSAWLFASGDSAGDAFFWILAAFWALLAGSYAYNRVRA
jgi:hypothetical protein